jgi:hypothetical protein
MRRRFYLDDLEKRVRPPQLAASFIGNEKRGPKAALLPCFVPTRRLGLLAPFDLGNRRKRDQANLAFKMIQGGKEGAIKLFLDLRHRRDRAARSRAACIPRRQAPISSCVVFSSASNVGGSGTRPLRRDGVTDDVTVTDITGDAVTGVTRDVMGRDVTAAFFLARYAAARSAGVLALLG